MPYLEISQELAEVLGRLSDIMKNPVEPLAESPRAPLAESPAGRDVLSCIEQAEKIVGRELTVFATAVGTHRFNARLYILEEERRGKKSHWKVVDVQPAAPQFLPDGLAHLRALSDVLMGEHEGKCIALWVNALPMIHSNAYFGLAIHKGGLIVPCRIDGGNWEALSMGDEALKTLVNAMLRPPYTVEQRWSTIVSKQMGVMRTEMRGDVEAFLSRQGLPGMTDDQWEELLNIVYVRKDYLLMLLEVGRSSGTELVIEAQRIGTAMVDLIDKAIEGSSEKMTAMEKAHTRALTRFKTDLAGFKSARDVAMQRTKQVEKELANVRAQLKKAGAGTLPQGGNERSLGLALDRFFV